MIHTNVARRRGLGEGWRRGYEGVGEGLEDGLGGGLVEGWRRD